MTSTKGVKFAGFFPTPYVVGHLTFVGEGGMGDLVWARIFFPKPLELEIFSLTYNGVRFFSALYTSRGKFFSGIFLQVPPPPHPKSVYRIFFSEITHNLLKSQVISP